MKTDQITLDGLEDLIKHFERLEVATPDQRDKDYFRGKAEGLNSAWKFLNGYETIETLKEQ